MLAYLCLRQTDSVGLTTFDSAVRAVIPPRGELLIPVKLLIYLVQRWRAKKPILVKFFTKLLLN